MRSILRHIWPWSRFERDAHLIESYRSRYERAVVGFRDEMGTNMRLTRELEHARVESLRLREEMEGYDEAREHLLTLVEYPTCEENAPLVTRLADEDPFENATLVEIADVARDRMNAMRKHLQDEDLHARMDHDIVRHSILQAFGRTGMSDDGIPLVNLLLAIGAEHVRMTEALAAVKPELPTPAP